MKSTQIRSVTCTQEVEYTTTPELYNGTKRIRYIAKKQHSHYISGPELPPPPPPAEFSTKKSIIHKIIYKQYLCQSTVIVASRPAAIAEIGCIHADKMIEVVGFKKEQIFEYFKDYPFSDQVNSKYAELKAYLSAHPNVLHMCYLPVHAAMIGFLFEVTGEVRQTETKIYEHFTEFTLTRNHTKSGDINGHDLSEQEKK